MIPLLRAELRKVATTRLWWALAIPVVVLSIFYNLFGALLAAPSPDLTQPGRAGLVVPLLSLAYTLSMTSVLGAVAGIVAAAGEFRHHTATTTYLLAPSRGRVLAAKTALGALVGALYAVAAAAVGLPTGLLGAPATLGDALPEVGVLLALVGVGIVVAALWAALGVGLGTALGNQVGGLVVVLVYLLLCDRVLALLLVNSDSAALASLPAYLPGKAADIAVFDVLARGLDLPGLGPDVVEEFTTVEDPPPWWGALLVLGGWTALVGGLGWWAAVRRDIT